MNEQEGTAMNNMNKPALGVAIPVFSLRTDESCGTGEFLDLIPFSDWCRESGLDLIQILPVNDTGLNNSPYSAISAFALNPLYVRIGAIPEAASYKGELSTLRTKLEKKKHLSYRQTVREKLALLKKIYADNRKEIIGREDLVQWLKENRWCPSYALFSLIRERNNFKAWKNWPAEQDIQREHREQLFSAEEKETWFYVWLQFHLEKQLKSAADHIKSNGQYLKGDLPILMSDDSCDVWANRRIFQLDKKAGAPPDVYSEEGQNWGFPTYNWPVLQDDQYHWWKERILNAAGYYHAYRIDHVLGFFRIWTIPESAVSAKMGYYDPFSHIKAEELRHLGFNDGRIVWLTQPHVPGQEIRNNCREESRHVIETCFSQIGKEDLYLFKEELRDESQIARLEFTPDTIRFLLDGLRNITLLPVGPDIYFPVWTYTASRAYNTLSEFERFSLDALITKKYSEAEYIWENHGTEILSKLTAASDMLVCAEDLGVVPRCVPEVLRRLGILSLKVVPWTRDYEKPDHPCIPFAEYPENSVCTTSVHDSETLRQWLKTAETRKDQQTEALFGLNGLEGWDKPEVIEKVISQVLGSGSSLVIFPVQDILAVFPRYADKDPSRERINIPGTVSDENWSWRIPGTVEEWNKDKDTIEKLKRLLSARRKN
jgi:4-alpha-glucanotransferase